MSELRRGFRFRIYPNVEQDAALRQWVGGVRFVYNLALEQRRDWWRQFQKTTGNSVNWVAQSREVTKLRAEVDWLAAIPRCALDQALRDLDTAYKAFFSGRANYPTPRRRGQNDKARLVARECSITPLNKKWSSLKLPKLGAIKCRQTRLIEGNPKNVTLSLHCGRWYASIATERLHKVPANDAPMVGIDRGIAKTISLSTGEHFNLPDMSRIIARKKASQMALARCRKGSSRRIAAKLRAARASARVTAARKHSLHEISTDIARRFGSATLEALRTKHMTAAGKGKRGLNRSILEQGWAMFATMLEYKLAERGGRVEYVNPAYTSQTCSECGCVARENRKSQAVFQCVECGHSDHADTNAALNILRRSPACVEGTGCGPGEARSGEMLTHLENLAA